MRTSSRIGALSLFVWLPFAPRSETQERFASEVVAALSAGDDATVRERVRATPSRALTLVHELLGQSVRPDVDASRSVDAARRIAAALLSETGSTAAAEVVRRFELLDPRGRERRAALDSSHAKANELAAGARLSEAEGVASEAARDASSLGEPYLEARALRLLGQIRKDRTRYDEARDALLRALALDEAVGARLELVEDLQLLGDIDFGSGRLAAALECYRRASPLAAALGEDGRLLSLLREQGSIGSILGRYAEARDFFERALALSRKVRSRAGQAAVLASLGALESACGRYGDSLRVLSESVDEWRSLGDPVGEGRVLVQLGGVLSEVGLFADAEAALERALAILDEERAPAERGSALVARGLALLDQGRPGEALEPLDRGRELLRRLGDAIGVADALRHRATALLELHRGAEAEASFREALRSREGPGSPFASALDLTGLGDVLARQGRMEEAAVAYGRALALAEPLGTPEATWRAHAGLGRSEEARGRAPRALEAYLSAIRDVEAIRTLLGAPSARQWYLGDKLEIYRRAARLLARSGRLDDAFRMSEAAKSWTLLDLERSRPIGGPPGLGLPKDVIEKLRAAESQVRFLHLRLAEVESGAGADTETIREDLKQRLRTARAEHEASRLQVELSDPRRAGLAGLGDPPSLTEVRQALPERAVLLEYLLGAEGSAVWVVRREAARFVELSVTEGEVASWVERIHRPIDRLQAGRTDLANLRFDYEAAHALHEKLVAPVASELEGADLLWIVPDGPLRKLPFALLVTKVQRRPVDPAILYSQYSGCRFLIEEVAIGYSPAAGLLAERKSKHGASSASGMALAVADPEPRPEGAAALVAARDEARRVSARLLATRTALYLGEDASETRVKKACESAWIIHLAVHGSLDDRRPSYSRLALAPGSGEDGWLHAYEVEELTLRAESVVLSACETVGSAGRGEGHLGLTRAFLIAGARSVVATAWVVDDEATALLMDRFYEAVAAGQPGVRALRDAQLSVMRSVRQPGLSLVHPFFWAGFLHVGAP